MNKHIISISLVAALIFASCGVKEKVEKAQEEAAGTFSDQGFKGAIALIELYNVRYGHYPASMDSLTFTSNFDAMAIQSVVYQRLDTGYRLDIANSIVNGKTPELQYPSEFWQGTGVKQSNLLK